MIVTVLEILRLLQPYHYIAVYSLILFYFWHVWAVKFVYSRFYKPVRNDFTDLVSVAIPTYREDKDTLEKAVNSILENPRHIVGEILIVTDAREPEVTQWCQSRWGGHIRVLVSPPGKRLAIRMAIEEAKFKYVAVIESDTFAAPDTIPELIKPFADPKVGGVVGDQQIFQPYTSLVTYFNHLVELIKYRITIPALSTRGQVTVLGGRCVAYRKKAAMPLVEGLTTEKFLGRLCISGDDGRFTSLLLQSGWNCVYQSTAKTVTISPPTWKALFKQRLRWFRNGSRRTVRALFCATERSFSECSSPDQFHTIRLFPPDRFWIWKRPLAAWQMLTVWTNTLMMLGIVTLHAKNFQDGRWLLHETYGLGVLGIVVILWLGSVLTRIVRAYPGIRETRKVWWICLTIFPFYLLSLWGLRWYAIFTMNKQGWLTREGGPGGFTT